jgi:hypothetical protein
MSEDAPVNTGAVNWPDADSALWVPETPHTSCDLLILVEQSTEPVVPSDGVCRARRSLGEWS